MWSQFIGCGWKSWCFFRFLWVFCHHYMPQYRHHYTHQLSMKKLMFFRCLWVFWATEYRALLSVVVIFYASSPANTPHTPIIIIPVFILTRSRIKDECSTIDQKILMILRQTRHTHTPIIINITVFILIISIHPFLSRLSFLANTPHFPTMRLKYATFPTNSKAPVSWSVWSSVDTSTLSNWLILRHEYRISNKNSKVGLLRTMRLSIKVKQKVNPQKSSFGL